ncbi:MAG TPA: ABC transporter substrate-binding protein [Planctomycetaceae bacterium]|nr:ABC transporter substrate-binding protein [Planctomycetaceae bacterium]
MRTNIAIALTILLLVGLLVLMQPGEPPDGTDESQVVVVYCAHDASFARPIIDEFERRSGIRVEVRYDEEASKSLGLTRLLEAEKENPRCDVFWNNQTLGTMRLQALGTLQPYVSPNAERIGSRFKDPDGYWTGFAGRLRVWLLNTGHVSPANEETIRQILAGDSLRRVTIAKAQFGTTLSHYSVIAGLTSLRDLQTWHHDLIDRGIRVVRGNSMTRDLVAEGVCDLGFTDTDDAFGAIDSGHPVKMLPVRVGPDSQTICIPNSVAMIKHCPHPDAAKAFIDYLLRPETELRLAKSSSRQIPLGEVESESVPQEVRGLQDWAADAIDLSAAADVNSHVLEWLTSENIEK